MNKLISVIVPVYNAEKSLHKCIDSIITQSYDNLEIILVNDGSTDLSGKICDEYAVKHNRISVIHSVNKGVSAARNKGLEIFKGEYVVFVDSDDELLPSALEILYKRICESNADISVGRIWAQNHNLKMKKYDCDHSVKILSAEEEILNCMLDDNYYCCYGKLIRRNIASKIRFVEGRKIHEDGFYIFQCLLACKKIITCNTLVYKYLYYPNSASNSGFSEKFYDILFFKEEKMRIISSKYSKKHYLYHAIAYKHDMALLNKMASCNSGYTKEELKMARNRVIKSKKYINITSKKERIRIFLVSYCFWVYRKIMMRNCK